MIHAHIFIANDTLTVIVITKILIQIKSPRFPLHSFDAAAHTCSSLCTFLANQGEFKK